MPLCLTFIWVTAGFSVPSSEEDDLFKDLEADLEKIPKTKSFAKSSPAVEAYLALSQKYLNRVEYDNAIKYANKGLQLGLVELGPEHPHIATTYNNIGVAYHDKGDKPKAYTYWLKAKAIYLKKLGAQHPSTKNVQGMIDDLK
jgi:tetratricopeptide (TPR) repeat protein